MCLSVYYSPSLSLFLSLSLSINLSLSLSLSISLSLSLYQSLSLFLSLPLSLYRSLSLSLHCSLSLTVSLSAKTLTLIKVPYFPFLCSEYYKNAKKYKSSSKKIPQALRSSGYRMMSLKSLRHGQHLTIQNQLIWYCCHYLKANSGFASQDNW